MPVHVSLANPHQSKQLSRLVSIKHVLRLPHYSRAMSRSELYIYLFSGFSFSEFLNRLLGDAGTSVLF